MKLLAFSGFARSGKDTAVNILVEEFGYTRLAFADKLRDFLYALNPVVSNGEQMRFDYELKYERLKNVIDKYGWDGYKETHYGEEIRNLLQRLGTEAGRQVIGDTIWIDATLNDLDSDGKYAVSDARFLNEFQAIKDRGGDIIRINRAGIGPVNNHPSELEALTWPQFDATINNDWTLDEFQDNVRGLINELDGRS